MVHLFQLLLWGFSISIQQVYAQNASYNNPVIPGWHSDPSCVFAEEWNNTTFCTTSTFLTFPGNPIFASADLVSWQLASNSLNRPTQFPQIVNAQNIQGLGMLASTLRLHNGIFYLITAWAGFAYTGPATPPAQILLFTTTNPYDDASWSDAIHLQNPSGSIDPDIFWDDDGSAIMAMAGSPIKACYIDLVVGNCTSETFDLWNGTGFASQEAPHLYKKDGYYYLLIAEGGTQYDHSSTIARSRSIRGPWESSPHNPLVTARYTDRYFQAVGHSDLIQDAAGNWWGIALATRGGPSLYNSTIYPMGRETVLYPVTWPDENWPLADQVVGEMSGPLPPSSSVPTFIGEPEIVDFVPGSSIPEHWVFLGAPAKPNTFTVSPPGHPNTPRLSASRANLTGDRSSQDLDGLTFVSRRQTSTLFSFSIDILPNVHMKSGDEIGITAFLNRDQHVDLGIVAMDSARLCFRYRATALGVNKNNVIVPPENITNIPASWLKEPIRLTIHSENSTHFRFEAAPAARPDTARKLAVFSTALISGDGATTGGLLGVYATTNGGNHSMEGFVSRWRYIPLAQQIDYDTVVDTRPWP